MFGWKQHFLGLKASITVLSFTLLIAVFAPDVPLDPWGLFNPKKFGYIILTLALLEFLSYITLKFVGEKIGAILMGFLGGFVSSTAVTLSSARHATKNPELWRTFAVATIAAVLASFIELLSIVFWISRPLLTRISAAIVITFLTGVAAMLILRRENSAQKSEVILNSIFDLKGIFRSSILFIFMLALIKLAENNLGHEITYGLSFLTGLFELHGITFANATLFSNSQKTLQMTNSCILLAVVASLFSKMAISWSLNRGRFSVVLSIVFSVMICVVGLTTLIN